MYIVAVLSVQIAACVERLSTSSAPQLSDDVRKVMHGSEVVDPYRSLKTATLRKRAIWMDSCSECLRVDDGATVCQSQT
jgi:hypothetical protein